jgi:hypothetical protein
MRHLPVCALLLCILLRTSTAAAAAADDFAYAWPVQAQAGGSAWQVELTPEVYAAVTTADLRDVAVVNAAGEAVPAAVLRVPGARPTTHEELLALPTFVLPHAPDAGSSGASGDAIRLQIERGADGRLRRIDADLGRAATPAAETRPDLPGPDPFKPDPFKRDLLLDASGVHQAFAAVRLDWAEGGADVSAQFAVDGSDDLQSWRVLAPRATVLRLTQSGNRLDRHDIALNNASAAYLRLRRLDDGAQLQGLTARLRTVTSSTAGPARQWLEAAATGPDKHRLDASFGHADGTQVVAWRYQLPAPLAIDSIRLELADDNSLARIVVLSRHGQRDDDPAAWMQRASLVAFRLRQDDGVIGNDELPAMPAARARDWRVESATPLEHAPKLSVGYQPDRFVFLAQGEGPYRLVAGSAKAQRGDYPVDAALASLRASHGRDWQPPLAALGARTTLKGDAALVAVVVEKPRDWKTWLLWAVLVGAAALIGGLALSLLKAGKGEKGEGRGKS